ncbi:MAG TPA: M23 family metallopeptidase, partial [Oscillatoriaceae cyanobacterium]
DGTDVRLYAWPQAYAAYTIKATWTLKDMVVTSSLPQPCVIAPGTRTLIATLHRSGPSPTFSWHIPSAAVGDMRVTSDDYLYGLPWRVGDTYVCGNAWNGFGGHTGDDAYAADFVMPVGTPVRAARGGVVFETKSDSDRGGADPSFVNDANYVYIWQDSGDFAVYAHFEKDGVVVKVGQRVQRGDLIGYSGQTGWATGPHLHFDVKTAKDETGQVTLPVKFQTSPTDEVGAIPELNASYTAY